MSTLNAATRARIEALEFLAARGGGSNIGPGSLSYFNIVSYGAKADTKNNFGGVTFTSGSKTVTMLVDATHPGVTADDVGKVIVLRQALATIGGGTSTTAQSGGYQNHPKPKADGGIINNPATTSNLVTSITSFISKTKFTIADAPTRSQAGGFAIWGTDNAPAINAANTAATNAGGGTILIPQVGPLGPTFQSPNAGMYLFASNIKITGGDGSTKTQSPVSIAGRGWLCGATGTPDADVWWEPQVASGSVLYAAGNVGIQLANIQGSFAADFCIIGSGNLPNVTWDDRGPDFDYAGNNLATIFPVPGLQVGGTGGTSSPRQGAVTEFDIYHCGFFNLQIGLGGATAERGAVTLCPASGNYRAMASINNLGGGAVGGGFFGNCTFDHCTGTNNDVYWHGAGAVGITINGQENNFTLGPAIYIGGYLAVVGYPSPGVSPAQWECQHLDLEQGGQPSVEIDLSTGIGASHIAFRNGGPSAQTGGVNGPIADIIQFDHGAPAVDYLTLDNLECAIGTITMFNCKQYIIKQCQDLTVTLHSTLGSMCYATTGTDPNLAVRNGNVLGDGFGGASGPYALQINPTTCVQTSGTYTISATDETKPVVVLAPTGGTLSNDLTVVFPNVGGIATGGISTAASYMLDVSAFGLNGHNLILQNAGGASVTISSISVNSDIIFVLINARGTNTIAVRA